MPGPGSLATPIHLQSSVLTLKLKDQIDKYILALLLIVTAQLGPYYDWYFFWLFCTRKSIALYVQNNGLKHQSFTSIYIHKNFELLACTAILISPRHFSQTTGARGCSQKNYIGNYVIKTNCYVWTACNYKLAVTRSCTFTQILLKYQYHQLRGKRVKLTVISIHS